MTGRAVEALAERLDGDGHLPEQPGWDCLACRQPWPCPPARVRLGEEYGRDRVSLSMYMAGLLNEAAGEIPSVTPQELFERFVAWTR